MFHEVQWMFHEVLWLFHGYSIKFYEVLWNSDVFQELFCEIPESSMPFYGSPEGSMP